MKILLKKTPVIYFIGKRMKRYFYSFITILSPVLNTKIRYRSMFKEKINLANPQTLNEKLSYLKLNEYNKSETVALCVDKIKVREYVKNKGYGEILNTLYFTCKDETEIKWDNLPERFALKWNFGSGYNIICPNIKNLDRKVAYKNLKKWGREKPWLWYSELQYKKIDKKILCEKYLEGGINGTLPYDYKVLCFNGEAKYIMVCCDREEDAKFFYFDRNWQIQNIDNYIKKYPDYQVNKPNNLNKMLTIAEDLANQFPFVRVDFYEIDGNLFFGEMTFTPTAGLDTGIRESDILLGNLLEIDVK